MTDSATILTEYDPARSFVAAIDDIAESPAHVILVRAAGKNFRVGGDG